MTFLYKWDNMKNQFILIHMSDDHFFIENQKNGKVMEFKGKNAREDAYAIINRLTRKETNGNKYGKSLI